MPVTETPAEINILKGLVVNRTDVKPNLSSLSWSWSEEDPYPPLQRIEKVHFWAHDDYAAIRERLLRPAPQLDFDTGGEFSTIFTKKLRRDPSNQDTVIDRHRLGEVCHSRVYPVALHWIKVHH